MSELQFFPRAGTPTVEQLAALSGAKIPDGAEAGRLITGVAPLDGARRGDLVFLDNPKYASALSETQASACFVAPKYAERVPPQTIALVTPDPYRAFALALAHLFPDALRPGSIFGNTGVSPGGYIHPEARLEPGVTVDPGAVIGPRAAIGAGSIIGAHAVIGPDVKIGRDCSIGPQATVQCALIGNRVIVHAGVRIGQDGFGFAMGPGGHLKVPQIGRVVIQNDVEIGANTTIDRGANRDTIIGEGTKIDNLVQIGHNVTIGRHCVIVSQVGISGSTEVGDFVAIGGQAGLTGHLKIGTAAQIGAQSGVMRDVPAGERWGGSPATPMRDWMKRVALLERLTKRESPQNSGGSSSKGN